MKDGVARGARSWRTKLLGFVIRFLGVRYDLNAPTPPLRGRNGEEGREST